MVSNVVLFLQMRSVGSHNTSGRGGEEGKKEGMGIASLLLVIFLYTIFISHYKKVMGDK